jgi:adenosylcobalamin-dependent ribonucleoside-triphosphate reductase
VSKKILDIHDEDRFALSDDFIEQYRDRKPDFGGNGLGELVYRRTYSRPKPDGTTEAWWETVRRVVEGVYTIQAWWCNREGLPWSPRKAQRSAREMYERMFAFKFLPPGRGLWALGTDYIEKNGSMALFNCSYISTADIDEHFAAPFTFLMDASMLGVGVGFDTKGAGKVTLAKPNLLAQTEVVEDSREGWVKLIERVLLGYVGGVMPTDIDYSQIRPAGSLLKGFGGVAAGPEPLKRCVADIQRILDPLVGKPITSTAIVDLMNVIGVCVVAGNIRRSAEIALGEPDDDEFLSLKDPSAHGDALMSHRWASNNSIYASIGMDYSRVAELIGKNGEPGLYFIENARAFGRMGDPADHKDDRVTGINPCAEIPLESGEMCNLVETFPSRHDTYEDYQKTLKYAYLLSKTVTLMPTHNALTNRVQKRNRRIGLSQSGIQQAIARRGLREHMRWCDEGYAYIQKLDRMYSEWLTIPYSRKTTTVKPSGSVSTLPYVTPGIHFEHSEFYFRLVRIAKTSHLIGPLMDAGYRIEQDVYDPSSMVVYFPIKAEHFGRAKSDVTLWEQLEHAAQVQYHWADNSVSDTVTFKAHEAADLSRALSLYETRLKSISFLPLDEHGYAQAPYQTITREEYESAILGIKPVRYEGATHEAMELWCDGEACEIPQHAPAA